MKGEFLSLETARKVQEKKVDKNMLEANIKLSDENKMLKRDNEISRNIITHADLYVRSLKSKFPDESALDIILNILQGNFDD